MTNRLGVSWQSPGLTDVHQQLHGPGVISINSELKFLAKNNWLPLHKGLAGGSCSVQTELALPGC